MTPQPEVWLRGPVAGVAPELMPAAHALLQAREDLERLVPEIAPEDLWAKPGEAAPAGYHIQHAAGALDRLLTYARGEALSAEQKAALAAEKEPGATGEVLLRRIRDAIDRGLAQLGATPASELAIPRTIGRAALPTSVRGLVFHAAEHTSRHVGQLITTLKVLRGRG